MSSLDDIVQLAEDAHALQRRGELRELVRMVHERQPKTVVEIGTCHGGTLRAWCECAADDALIVSIDLPDGPFGGGYHPSKQREMKAWGRQGQHLEFIRGNSHDGTVLARLVVHVLEGTPIDFLFIDGDHTYEGATDDFWTYGALVKPGGLIALHDVVPYPEDPRCQVHRFWDELRDRFDTTTIRTDGDYAGCGIGVLERPEEWRR